MVFSCRTLLVGLLLSSLACDFFARFAPNMVADGVSRLTVRNMGTLAQAIDADISCGFSNEAVKKNFVVDGPVGGLGSVTWEVRDCLLDFGDGKEVWKDCQGVITRAFGKVTVSAKRIFRGRLTGNPELPVIPETPDSVSVQLNARFDGFGIKVDGDENFMIHQSGGLSAVAEPRLAANQKAGFDGICMIPTLDFLLKDVGYANPSNVEVHAGSNVFSIMVEASKFEAQAGIVQGKENAMSGTIQIWGKELPVASDNKGLIPDYSREQFLSTFSCMDGLEGQVSYLCGSVKGRFASGVAPLSVLSFGQVAALIDANTDCGFLSPDVLAKAAISGFHGYDGGAATFSITKPCQIQMLNKVAIGAPDCHGNQVFAQGTIDVTGKKTVKGIRVLDDQAYAKALAKNPQPIVPTSAEPGLLDLSIDFTDFVVTTECVEPDDSNRPWHCARENAKQPKLVFKKGTLSGRVRPKMALNTDDASKEYGVCSRQTPVASFEDLSLTNADVELFAEGNQLVAHVDDSQFWAKSGRHGELENVMGGYLVLDGERIELAKEKDAVALDPNYEQKRFYDSFLGCVDDARIADDADCNLYQLLGENTARLIVQNSAGVLKLANQNTFGCGFQSVRTLVSPQIVQAGAGQESQARYLIQDCALGQGYAPQQIGNFNIAGRITMTGEMIHSGALLSDSSFAIHRLVKAGWNSYWGNAPKVHVNMTRPDAVTFLLSSVSLDHFYVASTTGPNAKLLIEKGKLAGSINPILAPSPTDPNSYFKETDAANFSHISLRDADAVLEIDEMVFRFGIVASDISARHGPDNDLNGSINIDGHRVDLIRLPLVPGG